MEGIWRAARTVDPVFLDTPQWISRPLGRETGLEILLKDETRNPLRSFKGRGTDWYVRRLPDERPLVCASAGNFGQGLARAARARGLALVVYAAEDANRLKVERMREMGAEVRLAGRDFDEAKAMARSLAEEEDRRFVEDGRAPAIAEGAGTIGLELLGFPRRPDVVLVPVGNGALAAGTGTAIRAESPATRLVGVCAAGARAMERSWRSGRPVSTGPVDTIADGIAVREPVPEVLPVLREVVDEMLLVDDDGLLRAMRLLHRETGIVAEPAGAAAVAAALRHGARLEGRLVATVVTGGNLTGRQMRRWLC